MPVSSTVLADGVVYLADDRFVCSATRCAGMTAQATGRTLSGNRLVPVDAAIAADWPDAELGPIACECGRVTHNPQGPDKIALRRFALLDRRTA